MILNPSEYSWIFTNHYDQLRLVWTCYGLLRFVTVCYELEWNRTCSKPIFIITFSNEVGNRKFQTWPEIIFGSVIEIASLHDDASPWIALRWFDFILLQSSLFRHQSCHHFHVIKNNFTESYRGFNQFGKDGEMAQKIIERDNDTCQHMHLILRWL